MSRIIRSIKRVITGAKECMLCPEDAVTTDGLCEACLDEMLMENHADYVRDLQDVCA